MNTKCKLCLTLYIVYVNKSLCYISDVHQKQAIRNAIQHWMDNTCITFEEVDMDATVRDHHIIFTKVAQA